MKTKLGLKRCYLFIIVLASTLFSHRIASAALLSKIQSDSRIKLSINYLQAAPGDTLELSVNNALLFVTEGKDAFATCNSKGVFEFDLPVKGRIGYFTLKRKRGSATNRDVDLLYPQLWESGDSIDIKIDHKDTNIGIYTTAIYSGKGSEKYTAKEALLKTKIKIDIPEKRYDGNIFGGLPENLGTLIIKKFEILDSYKSSISPDVFFIIKADLIAIVLSDNLNSITDYYYKNIKGRNGEGEYALKFMAVLFPVKNYAIPDKSLANSKGYLNYISKLCSFAVTIKETYNNRSVFGTIMANCSGEVREQMLVSFFSKVARSQEARSFYNKAVNVISDPGRKAAIENKLNSLPNTYLADYKFTDTEGKEVKISDFKDKAVLIDIWFTGCGYCGIYYKNVLSKIEEKYAAKKDFTILSISADRNKEIWKRSISANVYTGKGAVNIYTNGEGLRHPMFLNYAIDGAPTIILLNKKGLIEDFNSYSLRDYDSLVKAIEKL
nr:TlpA disulfide reductase family protein [Mucilaginibacter sp. L294]